MQAIARVFVSERRKPAPYALVFVAVFCSLTGFLVGDWTAEPRFAEREDSLKRYVVGVREDVDRLRESLKAGCYQFIDPTKPRSSSFANQM